MFLNIANNKAQAIAAKIIMDGGIVVIPTDTVYGIFCDAENKNAIERIYKIKERDISKNLIVMSNDISHFSKIAQISEIEEDILLKFLPGDYTFVLNLLSNGKKFIHLNAMQKDIAIRIPKNDFILKLIEKTGRFLYSTSANLSGKAASSVFKNVDESIKNTVDLCVHDDNKIEKESSILIDIKEISDDLSYTILRNEHRAKKFIDYIKRIADSF